MKHIGDTLEYDGQAAIIVDVRGEEDGSHRYDLRVFGAGGQDTNVPGVDLDGAADDKTTEGTLANEGGPDKPASRPRPRARKQ